jgi:CRISPR-associated protein Cas1
MPLYPPAQLVEHPADVVIDVFGAFLGKRSERMVIRWREPFGVGRRKDEEFPPTSGPTVLPRPLSIDQPVSDQPGSEQLVSDQVVSDQPVNARAGDGEDDTQPASNILPSSIEPDSSATPLDHPKSARPGARSGVSHPADAAAAELLSFWTNDPGPSNATVRPAPTARLAEQLDRLSEGTREDGTGREWQERAVPMSRLRSVTVAGRGVTISSDLIEALVERGIGLSFLSGRGQPVAQLSSPGLNGTVQTRRSQLAAYHTALGVQLAVEFIRGKLRNQKHQLQYSGKYLKTTDAVRFERLEKKIAAIANLRKQLATFEADELDRVRDKLMGFEGTGARLYWEGVALLLEGRAAFPGRQTRGAIDPINSALNYGYGILYGQVSAAIVNAGLELYAGFLHVDRAGKPALVLDLVEEFRAPVVDRVVLAMVNQGITLETDEHGLTAVTRRLVADRVLERIATAVPYEGKRWTLGSIIQNQARHLAVAVRGERIYRAFPSRW